MYKRIKNALGKIFFFLPLISFFSVNAEIHKGGMNAPSDPIVGKPVKLIPVYYEGIGPILILKKGLFIFINK